MEVVGSLWWVEVLSDDPPRAKQFYGALFGWQPRETAFEPFAAYTVFERGSEQEGGILPIGKDWGVAPHWNSIFAVDDCDAILNRTCELGGSTGFVHTVPKHGRLGSAIDPNGAWFWMRGPVPVAV
jgi:predicted enzyme related to lactoylglutathione lyase